VPGRSEAELISALAELVAIRSVSSNPFCAGEVARSAEWVAQRIREIGRWCTVERTDSGLPLTVGEVRASTDPDRAWDVLVYAHVDVQPAGDDAASGSPPLTSGTFSQSMTAAATTRKGDSTGGSLGAHASSASRFTASVSTVRGRQRA
jgi:hypothetical protein